MGIEDKARDKAQEIKGKGKKQVGEATENEQWQAEGRTEEAKGDLKQAGEKVKDAVRGR